MELPRIERADLGPRHADRQGEPMPIIEIEGRTWVLIPCDDWNRAEWRMVLSLVDVAANVTVTGKTIVRKNGCEWLRGKIEFLDDDEPSTFAKCLVRVA